jgi:hypothetical protein
MNDPEEYALAMDRLAAGIGPTLGPQHKLRERRRARARECFVMDFRAPASDLLQRNSRVGD